MADRRAALADIVSPQTVTGARTEAHPLGWAKRLLTAILGAFQTTDRRLPHHLGDGLSLVQVGPFAALVPCAAPLIPSSPSFRAATSGALAADKALFASLNASIPAISPRGTRNGDWTGVVYDIDTDPDCWWTDTKCTSPKLAGLPDDVSSCPEPNTWGFTLDDGPNCSHNAFYDYLQEVEQKATLFYIGSNVADWPLEGQRGLADGHEICAHSKSTSAQLCRATKRSGY